MKYSGLPFSLVLRATTAALVICLLSSCDRDNNQHTHAEMTQLQAEFEQLGNQVGRLEFRIYELENHHSAQPPAGDAAAGSADPDSGSGADTPVNTAPDAGRYDLTPVNP